MKETLKCKNDNTCNSNKRLLNRATTKSGSLDNNVNLAEANEIVFKNVHHKWNWKVEILLLKFIEDHGLFSWIKIANLISDETDLEFTAQEVQNHFSQYYLEGTLGQVWNYQLVKKPVLYIDHTEDEPVSGSSSEKYLPLVGTENLKDIKFLPHRDEFEVYPQDMSELMVTQLDFSSFYLNNLTNLNIGEEVKDLQLAIVDSYIRKVAERIALRKFMKDYKLIEQYFITKTSIFPCLIKKPTCSVDIHFKEMKKFIPFFDTSNEFLDFYYGCVKENLLKLEIIRLAQTIQNKKRIDCLKQRNSEANLLLKKRAPSFLNVGLFLHADENIILHRGRRKKRKFKFTRRKGFR